MFTVQRLQSWRGNGKVQQKVILSFKVADPRWKWLVTENMTVTLEGKMHYVQGWLLFWDWNVLFFSGNWRTQHLQMSGQGALSLKKNVDSLLTFCVEMHASNYYLYKSSEYIKFLVQLLFLQGLWQKLFTPCDVLNLTKKPSLMPK